MKKQLPIYNVVLDENNPKQGVGSIATVDDPAIQVNWIKLKNEVELIFKAVKDKQLLYGPFLIPNKLIYRNDEKMGEYYIRFSAEEIEKIATKFNGDLNNANINFMHTSEKVNAFVASNWVIEGEQDKSRNFGYDLPIGTWFGSVKIMDEKFWQDKVKTDEVKGFSVEIMADLEIQLKNNKNTMSEIKLTSANLLDGTKVYFDGEIISVDTLVYSDEAMTVPMADGSYTLEDNSTLEITNGMCSKIGTDAVVVEEQAEVPAPPVDETKPAETGSITADEVSSMIDARFGELMNEITKIKESLNTNETEMTKFKAETNEKLSMTPALQSIVKDEPKIKLDSKFSRELERVRDFKR